MASTLFVVLATLTAGYLGANAWAGRDPRVWPLTFIVCACAFPLICLLIGAVLSINAFKIMIAAGLLVFIVVVLALLSPDRRDKKRDTRDGRA